MVRGQLSQGEVRSVDFCGPMSTCGYCCNLLVTEESKLNLCRFKKHHLELPTAPSSQALAKMWKQAPLVLW